MANQKHFLKIFLISGLGIGLLSSAPFLSVGNCCCLWTIAGGIFSAWLLCKWAEEPVDYGQGFLVGLFSGLTGGAIFSFFQAFRVYLYPGSFRYSLEQSFQFRGMEPPPEVEQLLEQLASMLAHPFLLILISSFFSLLIFAIMTALGCLIGVLIFEPRFATKRTMKRIPGQVISEIKPSPPEPSEKTELYFPRKEKEEE